MNIVQTLNRKLLILIILLQNKHNYIIVKSNNDEESIYSNINKKEKENILKIIRTNNEKRKIKTI
jgi:hypothetical protein